MNSKLVIYYLTIKTHLLNILATIRLLITNTKEVVVLDNSGEKYSVLARYFMIRVLVFINRLINKLLNLIDISVDKLQYTKEFSDGNKTVIVDSEMLHGDQKVTLRDVVDQMDGIDGTNPLGNTVFFKFELANGDEQVCLKDYVLKYRDHQKEHHHTLKNIIMFNDIDVEEENCKVNVVLFKNGQFKNTTLEYKECKEKHISDFYELE